MIRGPGTAMAVVAAVMLSWASVGASTGPGVSDEAILAAAAPATLSAFGFFGASADQPSQRLIRYDLATPLFSDYSDKDRFIYLPAGTNMRVDDDGRVIFPVGAAIIKTFSFAQPDGSRRVIETRLLLHQARGWVALPYIWRADGSDADLRIGGGRMPVTASINGRTMTFSYAVPNRNQCRTCHQHDEVLVPIGPRLRNIGQMTGGDGGAYFPAGVDRSMLTAVMPRWDDQSAPLDQRARAYLDANCAHCHNPRGSASNSGMFLEYERPLSMAVGVWKRPVAAGRGSGGLDYAIHPARPDLSYLPYRMHSTDPGIAMPELGRSVIHDEGVALIRQWIAAMPAGQPPTALSSAGHAP